MNGLEFPHCLESTGTQEPSPSAVFVPRVFVLWSLQHSFWSLESFCLQGQKYLLCFWSPDK